MIILSDVLRESQPLAGIATLSVKLPIVIPLIVVCASIIAGIPYAASRGKLHIPGYAGIAALALATGLLLGHLAGAREIVGTTTGVILSVVFFLLMAAVVGSILALFFYRHEPEQ